jgi:hypothetical protein
MRGEAVTVYKVSPMARVYHWKYGEGLHQPYRNYSWTRERRDRERERLGQAWSECGHRLLDPDMPYTQQEEDEVAPEQRCSGTGCYQRWRTYDRAWTRARRARALEEAQRRDLEVSEGGDPGRAAADGAEGMPGVPGQGTRGGVAGGEGGGLPGPQDAGTVQGHMATYADGLNGIQVRLDALRLDAPANTAANITGNLWTAANTVSYNAGGIAPPPPTCACGQPRDDFWVHAVEECTWRERV